MYQYKVSAELASAEQAASSPEPISRAAAAAWPRCTRSMRPPKKGLGSHVSLWAHFVYPLGRVTTVRSAAAHLRLGDGRPAAVQHRDHRGQLLVHLLGARERGQGH